MSHTSIQRQSMKTILAVLAPVTSSFVPSHYEKWAVTSVQYDSVMRWTAICGFSQNTVIVANFFQKNSGTGSHTPGPTPYTPTLTFLFLYEFLSLQDNSQWSKCRMNQSTAYIILASSHMTTTVHSILVEVTGPLALWTFILFTSMIQSCLNIILYMGH